MPDGKPWEKYGTATATEDGPWSKYGGAPESAAIPGAPNGLPSVPTPADVVPMQESMLAHAAGGHGTAMESGLPSPAQTPENAEAMGIGAAIGAPAEGLIVGGARAIPAIGRTLLGAAGGSAIGGYGGREIGGMFGPKGREIGGQVGSTAGGLAGGVMGAKGIRVPEGRMGILESFFGQAEAPKPEFEPIRNSPNQANQRWLAKQGKPEPVSNSPNRANAEWAAKQAEPETPSIRKAGEGRAPSSEGRPATWTNEKVRELAAWGDPEAIEQAQARGFGRIPLRFSTVESSPMSQARQAGLQNFLSERGEVPQGNPTPFGIRDAGQPERRITPLTEFMGPERRQLTDAQIAEIVRTKGASGAMQTPAFDSIREDVLKKWENQ